ncbi:MAG: hypothetical protein HYY17_02860 [Planctomycetes bacterium]|nr:hypothetical protein [Planctomycetota bacterium]
MKKTIALMALLAGCTGDDADTPPPAQSEPQIRVLFTLNVHDWAFPDRSLDGIRYTMGVHESQGIPLDVFVTDPAFRIIAAGAPDVVAKLKGGGLFAGSYHFRPPVPYAEGSSDFIGLEEMGESEAYAAVLAYEEAALDLETGLPVGGQAGGCQFVKDTLGYAPVMVGTIARRSEVVSAVLRDKGVSFAVVHGRSVALGEQRNGLYLRPEDVEIRLLEYVDLYLAGGITGARIVEDALAGRPGPLFLNIKLHENDYYARPAPFWAVYADDHFPPWDTDLATQVELKPAEYTEAMKQLYAEVVAYVAGSPQRFACINAFQLKEMVGAE